MDKQDILDLIDNGHNMEEYETMWEFFDAMNYNGDIDSLVDSSIDIYNYDLRKWAVENYDCIEEAMSEGLAEGVEDFHKLIQCGQWVYFKTEADRLLEEIWEEYEEKTIKNNEAA